MRSSTRKNIHNRDIYRTKILNFIKKLEGNVTTTSEIASNFKISWNTAEKYLLELLIEGKIIKVKKEGVNLWLLKK